jgi:hypothetical protein
MFAFVATKREPWKTEKAGVSVASPLDMKRISK